MEVNSVNRRLAAIMAADVVGYSRLMESNEAGTLAALNNLRDNTFNPSIVRHNGRIVKLMGDGILAEFASVVDAVNCAIDVQQAALAMLDVEPKIVLRIGINLGDVITQDNDIYGDGVNIAARLEQLAQSGGVCISSVVKESIGGRIDAAFTDGGEVSVKNIDRPLRVFHWHPDLAPSGTGEPLSGQKTQDRSENPSIAVLPFENMSGDPEQEYFSDGISEDIITDLSKVSGLTVIARNSSFAYRGKSVDLRVVGQELNVTSVLEGSVRRAGQRVRITAQLVDTATGAHVWADRFDRDLTDIFAVQDEVTIEIVNALRVRLTPAERASIANIGTTNLEAHEYFMRMRGFLFFPGMNAEMWRHAAAHGERAIELDPGYAQAYAMLSIMHVLDFHNNWSGADNEAVLSKAGCLADRAIEIAPDEVLPNHALAVVARWRGDLDLAVSAIGKALLKSPDHALGLFTRGEIFISTGHLAEAIRDIERAIRLDPGFTHQYLQFLGMARFLQGNYETAVLVFKERLLLAKDTDIGRAWLASALGHIGDVAEAQRTWEDLRQINPDFSFKTRLARLNFTDPANVTKVMDGLAKAGLQD